jgi:Na+/H+ antiporter NhaD/arsenite permease-like protein
VRAQAWVALLGATVMVLVARPHDIDHVLLKIEWSDWRLFLVLSVSLMIAVGRSTLLFFMTLFVMLEGLSELGLVKTIGAAIGTNRPVNRKWRMRALTAD